MSTLTATQLQQQYIAYFGRPGDPAGIKYWLSSSSGISSAREFADKIYAQDEYKTSTVGSKSTEAQVNSLYQNLFGREADASGLIYWTGQIENGILTLSNIAFDLIAAASNPVAGNETQAATDAQVLSNKVAAAEAFTADVEASTSAILAYQPETTTPWKTGSAFESGATYLDGITTTAHTDTAIDSAVTSMIAANTSAGSATAGTTYKFTSTTDALIGGAGNDKFNGVLQLTDAAAVTGTTIAPGDDVEGKGGTDTVAIAVAGTQNTGFTLSAVATNDVENVTLSNFETSTSLTTVDASLMNGLTTVGLSSSSATGDSAFSGVKNLVDAEMRNGSADLTVTYTSSVVSGESDTQNLTVSNLSNGTFTANGAETIVIKSEVAKSKLRNVTGTGNTAINITGDKGLTISNSLTQKTIDASASTGGVDLNIGTATSTVTGGSGDDSIQFKVTSDITKDDTIKGGAGTDTLKLAVGNVTLDGESDTTGQELYGVSGFEIIDIDSTHDNADIELDTLEAGITTLKAAANTIVWTPAGHSSDDGTTKTVAYELNGVAYTTAAVDLQGNVAQDLPLLTAAITTSVNSISGWEAVDNSTTVTITNTGTEETQVTATDVATEQSHTFSTTKNVSFSDAAANQTLDIYSGAIVKLRLKDASGDSDIANVNLKSVSGDKALDTTIEDLDIANTESLNLSTSGKSSTAKYTVSDLSGDASLTALNITGTDDLVVSDTATGNTKLVTVDAASFTGDLTLSTMTASANQTVTTGSGNDNVDFGANLTEDDVIDLGGNSSTSGGWQATTGKTGKDKLEATGNLGSTATDDAVLQIKNVEVFEIATGGVAATYIDASKMSNIGLIGVSSTSGTVKIKNLEAGTNIGMGIGTDELIGTLDVALADATGTEDSLGLVFPDTVDGAGASVTLKTTGIETINITATKDATDAGEVYEITTANVDASKIVLTGGNTSYADTYDLATLNKAITTVDASALDGILTIDGIATDVATTISHKGTQVVTANLSGGNDTISLGTIGIVIHDIDTSTGTDTLSATLSSAASNFTSVDGVETFNLTIKDETATGFNHASKINGLNEATTVNILGGNALSTFTIATGDIHDDSIGATDNIEVLDASTFGGTFDVLLDPTAFDDTLTIKGPTASTSDVIRFDAQEADGKIKSMTGIETLALFTSDSDTDGVVDLTNATGVTKITLAYTNNNAADAVEFKKVEAGTVFQITSTQTADAVTIGMADASTTTTALTVELMDFEDSVNDTFDLNAAGVETLTINDKSADSGEILDLAGVTATTGSKTKLILQGGDLILGSLSSSFNVVDAATATGGITLTAANRPNTSMTITGGLGGDSLTMENKDDVIDGGLGTDTLTITGNAVLGGYAVDLTSSTDQLTQFAGTINASIQKGFENFNASAVTGSFGADITGTTGVNVIVGTNQIDNINPGLGADDITMNGGNDFVDITESTGSVDKIRFITSASNGVDTITGFDVAGKDIIVLPLLTDAIEGGGAAGTGIEYDEGASASDTLADDAGVYVDTTDNLGGLTAAAVDSSAGDMVTTAGDKFFYVASDGTDTHIFNVTAASTTVAATDTIIHVGTIVGLSDASTLSLDHFAHVNSSGVDVSPMVAAD